MRIKTILFSTLFIQTAFVSGVYSHSHNSQHQEDSSISHEKIEEELEKIKKQSTSGCNWGDSHNCH